MGWLFIVICAASLPFCAPVSETLLERVLNVLRSTFKYDGIENAEEVITSIRPCISATMAEVESAELERVLPEAEEFLICYGKSVDLQEQGLPSDEIEKFRQTCRDLYKTNDIGMKVDKFIARCLRTAIK